MVCLSGNDHRATDIENITLSIVLSSHIKAAQSKHYKYVCGYEVEKDVCGIPVGCSAIHGISEIKLLYLVGHT